MNGRDFDVVVIGGGGAGPAAAYAAAAEGRRVLLLEAGDALGGSLALAGGVFYAANTSVQRAAGITDTPEAMFRFYMAVNHYRLDAAVIRRLCIEAAPTFEWLVSLGVCFPETQLYAAGLDGVRRGHRAFGMGREIADALQGALSEQGKVDVALRSRVTGLERAADGAVIGVQIDGQRVSAGAVIVATGDFGANKEMVSRYLPRTAIYGDWVWYIGAPTNRGDGIAMGLSAGGTVSGIDTGSIILTPFFGSDYEPFTPGWFMFVSHEGRRFADETIDYSIASNLVRALPGGECFALFDEPARLSPRPGNMASKDQQNAYPFTSWTPDRLAAMADSGKVLRADSVAALAEKAGINVERLLHTVAIYNRDCDEGQDTMLGKAKELMKPLRTTPFYAVRLRPAVIGVTGAGLRTDAEARVLDAGDRPIPGLYAAGNTVGGIHGEVYVGSGAMIANAITYGRIAGRNAARTSVTPAA
jgi:fumarate reductase flavoprotein subunit